MKLKRLFQNIWFYLTFPINIKKDIWYLKANLDKRNLKRVYDVKLVLANSYIGDNAQFGNIPALPHGLSNIHISGDAKIGKNAVIFQGVTIGSNTLIDSKKKGSPTIGDDCYIGAGAKIIGKITIGNNCRIGANAVVYKDVPDNSTVILGGGMRVVPHDQALDNRFFSRNERGEMVYWDDGIWVLPENAY